MAPGVAHRPWCFLFLALLLHCCRLCDAEIRFSIGMVGKAEESGQYGLYFDGLNESTSEGNDAAATDRHYEHLLMTLPDYGQRIAHVVGKTNHAWVVRSADFEFRVKVALSFKSSLGQKELMSVPEEKEYWMSIKNLGENPVQVRWPDMSSTWLRQLDQDIGSVAAQRVVSVGDESQAKRLGFVIDGEEQ
eukprot:TRINITY_DN25024_c0_g2_i1.p1 TRINITY_DN25024_c0_g2~~TRINITY_DN25024_c0_g2_i1.p1  ORF type:complete len:199 (-),score=32.31 TRINITY_DN25024_c0_g2_i1:44-613(-)